MSFVKKLVVLAFAASTLSVFGASTLKQEYKELKATTNKKINVLDKKLEKMGHKVSKMSGKAKVQMKNQYDELVEMKNELKVRLADAGEATEDSWDNFKDKVEDYADNLESRVDEAIN